VHPTQKNKGERFEVVNILEGHRDIESYFSEHDEQR
jgi:hypothetical protein